MKILTITQGTTVATIKVKESRKKGTIEVIFKGTAYEVKASNEALAHEIAKIIRKACTLANLGNFKLFKANKPLNLKIENTEGSQAIESISFQKDKVKFSGFYTKDSKGIKRLCGKKFDTFKNCILSAIESAELPSA